MAFEYFHIVKRNSEKELDCKIDVHGDNMSI